MKKTRKDLIKDLIDEYTAFYINEGSYSFDLCNAEDISLTLDIDRSNVSRLLNQMFNRFELIKVKGRPTLFLSKEVLTHEYNYSNIPQVIDSRENLIDLFAVNTTNKSLNVKSELDIIGNSPEGSLFSIVNMIVPAVIFPQTSVSVIVLEGKHGSGRKFFCRRLFEYAQKNKRFNKSSQIFYVNYSDIVDKRNGAAQFIDVEHVGMIVVQVDNSAVTDSVNQFLSSVSNVYANRNLQQPVVIFVTDSGSIRNQSFFKSITPYFAKFPSLHDRPVKELIEIVVKEIQLHADSLNTRIKITNDTIMTFVNTDYTFGIRQMINELRAVITRVSYLNRHVNSNVLYISNDLLTSDVFANIRDDLHYHEQARQIVIMLFPEVIDFLPHKESEAELLLRTIYKGDRIFVDVPKRSIMQQARFDILSMSTDILAEQKPENQRLSFLLSHLFNKTSIRDDIPLLSFLYTQINAMIQGRYIVNYAHDDILAKENELSRDIANTIIEIIESKYDMPLKSIYKSYIRNYIFYALTLTPTKKISFIILSSQFGLAENYAQHINHYLGLRACYSYCYNSLIKEYNQFEFTSSLSIAVKRADKGKGVLMISDRKLPNRQEVEIVSKTDIPVVSLYRTSLYLLQETTKYIDIPSLNLTVLLYNAVRTKKTIKQFHADTTLVSKQERAMSDLLISNTVETFEHLSVLRSSEILYNVLKEICYRLSLEITNNMVVEFIFHMNFMLERYATQRVIYHENIEVFKKQHDHVYHTVRKAIQSQKELLGYVFSESEFVVISGLILHLTSSVDTIQFTKN